MIGRRTFLAGLAASAVAPKLPAPRYASGGFIAPEVIKFPAGVWTLAQPLCIGRNVVLRGAFK